MLMTDGDVDDSLRYGLAAELIFTPEQDIPLTREAADFLRWFYHCGEPPRSCDENDSEYFLESRLPYRFDADFKYIHAAFLELYGIDLITVDYLHWWTFRGLFRSLHDCRFTDIVRTCLHKLKSTQQGLQIGNNTNIFLVKSPNFIVL